MDSQGLAIVQCVIDGSCWVLIFIGIAFISHQGSHASNLTPSDVEDMHAPSDAVHNPDKSSSAES